ncbi:MAG: hypothetical protein U0794_14110 [Isosphaeraceae bacterium]
MNPEADLIHGYLDDQLSEQQLGELNDRLAHEPEFARRFALAALLHDRLRDRFREDAATQADRPEVDQPTLRRPRGNVRRVALAAGSAALVVALVLLVRSVGDQQANAAEAALGRLIEAQTRVGDRSYRIIALDSAASTVEPVPPRGRPRPTIDGALLHVGGDGRYVLVRQPGQPAEFVTGCDGREAWAVPPDGPVRVSADIARFRGAVPGEQQGLPFLDLSSALVRLREAYDLSLDEGPPARLVAHKRSSAHRGPRDVTIGFDSSTGVIWTLRMDGMPQAQGGPRSVALELVERRDLGSAFFGHSAHHVPDRQVVRESP